MANSTFASACGHSRMSAPKLKALKFSLPQVTLVNIEVNMVVAVFFIIFFAVAYHSTKK